MNERKRRVVIPEKVSNRWMDALMSSDGMNCRIIHYIESVHMDELIGMNRQTMVEWTLDG